MDCNDRSGQNASQRSRRRGSIHETEGDKMPTRVPFTRRRFLAASLGSGTLLAVPRVFAQAAYPERPITFVCPWPAGGTADLTMRALCAAAAKPLGQTLVVENKAGAPACTAMPKV